jgi:hypothetical protein
MEYFQHEYVMVDLLQNDDLSISIKYLIQKKRDLFFDLLDQKKA